MKKLIVALLSFCFIGCSIHKSDDIVLTVPSMFGATVIIATFNGNSASKLEDCSLIGTMMSERFNRNYSCHLYKEVKSELEK